MIKEETPETTHPQLKEKKILPEKKITIEKKSASPVSPVGKMEPGVETRLGMNLLESNNVDEKLTYDFTLMLYKKLRALKDDNRIVYKAYDKSDKNVNRQLVGRISRLGSSYVLRITVIEGESGKRLFDKTLSHKENESFESAAGQIVNLLNNEEKIWKTGE